MLLKNSSFLCPAIRENNGLSCDKSKISFLRNNANKVKVSIEKNSQNSKIKAAVIINGAGETIHKELEMPSMVDSGKGKGIGIINFFEGKNIFLTGATGLLGKGLFIILYTLFLNHSYIR